MSARIEGSIVSAAKERAELENVSLSAIVERALSEYLKAIPSVFDEPAANTADAQRLAKLEQRVSTLEAQQQPAQRGRKGKRR